MLLSPFYTMCASFLIFTSYSFTIWYSIWMDLLPTKFIYSCRYLIFVVGTPVFIFDCMQQTSDILTDHFDLIPSWIRWTFADNILYDGCFFQSCLHNHFDLYFYWWEHHMIYFSRPWPILHYYQKYRLVCIICTFFVLFLYEIEMSCWVVCSLFFISNLYFDYYFEMEIFLL